MHVRIGDTVEPLYNMSHRGEVVKIYFVPVTAGTGTGSLTKARRIVFKSNLDGKLYDLKAQDLRVVRE